MILTAIIIVGGISGINAETPKTQYTLDTMESNSVEQKRADSISVATDKTNMVTAPNGNLITIAQIEIDDKGIYSTDITVGGKLYNTEGVYTITTTSQGFETSTTIGYGTPIPEYISNEPSLADIDYVISGGEVDTIYSNPDTLSITVDLIDADGGEITLTLPRDIIDSTTDGVDDVFFVLVDGYEAQYTEVATETDRTITIPFSAESSSIEIIGTFVIPEFGTIAMMILAVAIISMVVVTRKARLVAI